MQQQRRRRGIGLTLILFVLLASVFSLLGVPPSFLPLTIVTNRALLVVLALGFLLARL